MTSERAQKIWDTYINGYSEALMTPVEDFSTYLDEDSRKIIASVLRKVVEELKYIGITEKNILELANELEAL
jgi:DNA-binding transcriptional regulator YhcF (GntR family)